MRCSWFTAPLNFYELVKQLGNVVLSNHLPEWANDFTVITGQSVFRLF